MSAEETTPEVTAPQSRRRRNRVPLSCTICRKRRLRCDKQKPYCSNCKQLNIAHLCHYMRQIWASNDDMWSEDDEISFLKRKMTNLSQLLDLSTRLNSMGLVLNQGTEQIVYRANEIELNFTLGMSSTENKPNWENKFRYNPSHNPVTILKTDPALLEVWNNVTKLHEKLAEELGNSSQSSDHSDKDNSNNENNQELPAEYSENILDAKTSQVPLSGEKEGVALSTTAIGVAEVNASPLAQSERIEYTSSSGSQITQAGIDDDNNPRKRNSIANMLNVSDAATLSSQPQRDTPVIDVNVPIEVTSDGSSMLSDKEHLDRITNNGVVNREDILGALLNFMPSRLETELLIQTFFKYLYPYLPFLDAKNIKIQFDRIFPFTSDTLQHLPQEPKLVKVSLSNYNDYCNLGIIVLIIKLTELSFDSVSLHGGLFGDNEAGERSIDPNSSLFQHRIPMCILDTIERNFINIEGNMIGTYVTLPLIHFTILSRVYSESANDVDYLFASRCSVENIVQLALSFGLNIDPNNHSLLAKINEGNDRVSVAPNIDRFKHTWRKTWYFIVSLDVNQSFDFGRTRLLKNLKQVSNTKLPIFSNVDYVKDIQELVVVKNFTLFYELDLIIISILRLFEDVRRESVTKLKFDVIIGALVRLATGKASTKEALLTLDNLNILPEQEGWLRVLFVKDANEWYNLPNIDQLLDTTPDILNLSELERKLEIPRKSMSNSLLFVKHIVLRHLIFELCWKASASFPLESRYGQFSVYYGKEAYNWTVDILNNIVLFFNESIESPGMATRIITPPLLQPLFASLQYLTTLLLKKSPIFENAGNVLLNSITTLLKKIAKYNKRSEVIFEFINKFNTLYPHESYVQQARESVVNYNDSGNARAHSPDNADQDLQRHMFGPRTSFVVPDYHSAVAPQQYLQPVSNTQSLPEGSFNPAPAYPSYQPNNVTRTPYAIPVYMNHPGSVYNPGQVVSYPPAIYYPPVQQQQQFAVPQNPNQYFVPYQVVTFPSNAGIQYVQQSQPYQPPNTQQNANSRGPGSHNPPEEYPTFQSGSYPPGR